MGLDERLVRDLLFAGLNCPAFNDRQKYTLCINAQEIGDSVKFPDISRWFPFDTLAKKPTKDENCLMVCTLVSPFSPMTSFHSVQISDTSF